MSNRKVLEIANIENKVILSFQSFLDSDFDTTEGNIIRMSVIIDEQQTIEYTINGADYYNVNSNVPQEVDGSYFYRFPAGNVFNARIKGGVPANLKSFKVELWLEV